MLEGAQREAALAEKEVERLGEMTRRKSMQGKHHRLARLFKQLGLAERSRDARRYHVKVCEEKLANALRVSSGSLSREETEKLFVKELGEAADSVMGKNSIHLSSDEPVIQRR